MKVIFDCGCDWDYDYDSDCDLHCDQIRDYDMIMTDFSIVNETAMVIIVVMFNDYDHF